MLLDRLGMLSDSRLQPASNVVGVFAADVGRLVDITLVVLAAEDFLGVLLGLLGGI